MRHCLIAALLCFAVMISPEARACTGHGGNNRGPVDPEESGGDPVNLINGNMFNIERDIFIPDTGPDLLFERTYNSRSDYHGVLGYFWTHSYNMRLDEAEDDMGFTDEWDAYHLFTKNAAGDYDPPPGKHSELIKNPDDTWTLIRKHGKRYDFDSDGRLTAVTDRNDNQKILEYSAGLLTTVKDSSGRELSLSYNHDGYLTRVTDPDNREIDFSYDAHGHLTQVSDPAGAVTAYSYDANHRMTQKTNPEGHSTYWTYCGEGRAISARNDDDINKFTFYYDPANNETHMTDALGNTTIYNYSATAWKMLSITDHEENTTAFSWDSDLNRTSITDPNFHTTYFTYDDRGNMTSTTDPLGNTTTFTYEPDYNLVTSITDPLNNTTTYQYDANGNLVKVIDAKAEETEFTYDAKGQMLSTTDPRDNTTTYSYDQYGNVSSITDPEANTTTFSYDVLGNLLEMTDAKDNTTSYQYDINGRLTSITYPDASDVSYTYDSVGNQTSVTDQEGNITTYAYDVANRLIEVTDAEGGVTSYTYDNFGNRTGVTDARGKVTTYTYDTLNRLTETMTPLGHTTEYAYDAAGNRTSKTDANNDTILYAYDANNRLTLITYPDTGTVEYQYDDAGRRTQMQDHTGTTTYSYNELGHVTSVSAPGPDNTITYDYDAAGNRIEMTDQCGGVTVYEYDSLNRLIKITCPQNELTEYTYDAASNLTEMQLPNDTLAQYQYDDLHRLLKLTNLAEEENNPGGNVISSYQYQYDLSGNRTRVTLADGDYIDYNYDSNHQLTSEVKTEVDNGSGVLYSYQYEFDAAGNRESLVRDLPVSPVMLFEETEDLYAEEVSGFWDVADFWEAEGLVEFSYTYDDENRLIEVEAQEGLTTHIAEFQYDDNGNLIEKTEYEQGKQHQAETTTYAYDYENRLTGITYPDGSSSEYVYDGAGRRVKAIERDAGDNITEAVRFLYDGLNVIIERELEIDPGTGELTGGEDTAATYKRGLSYGGGIGGIISRTDAEGERLYYHYDGGGNVRTLTDENDSVVQEYEYDAYGNVLSAQGSADNPYKFSIKEYSPKSGLSYFGARYYDPRVGRWTSKDPLTWGPDDWRQFDVFIFYDPMEVQGAILASGGELDAELLSSNADEEFRSLAILYTGAATPAVYNRYTFCFNNPIKYFEDYGLFPHSWKGWVSGVSGAAGWRMVFTGIGTKAGIVLIGISFGMAAWDAYDYVETTDCCGSDGIGLLPLLC